MNLIILVGCTECERAACKIISQNTRKEMIMSKATEQYTQQMSVAMRTPDEAYAEFRAHFGAPHGDCVNSDGRRSYDVEFRTLVDAVAAYNALRHYFHAVDLRSAIWPSDDDPGVTSLTDPVTMTFVCFREA